MAYTHKAVDALGSEQYRLYFQRDEQLVSPFHDITLWADKEKGIANMVVEIPRGTRAKLEISKGDALNPIKQDIKKGKLRFVFDPYPFNYGAFPQTWENPKLKDERTQAFGDNDPLDVVEIGTKVHKTGDVIKVKILGTYAMIDAGETDWKIVAIDVTDENADKYHDCTDIPKEKLDTVFTFLRDYKIPDGAPANEFAFKGELKNKEFARKVADETYDEWHKLITGKTPAKTDKYEIKVECTHLKKEDAPSVVTKEQAEDLVVAQFRGYLRAKQ